LAVISQRVIILAKLQVFYFGNFKIAVFVIVNLNANFGFRVTARVTYKQYFTVAQVKNRKAAQEKKSNQIMHVRT
jgi:hypothetical protein